MSHHSYRFGRHHVWMWMCPVGIPISMSAVSSFLLVPLPPLAPALCAQQPMSARGNPSSNDGAQTGHPPSVWRANPCKFIGWARNASSCRVPRIPSNGPYQHSRRSVEQNHLHRWSLGLSVYMPLLLKAEACSWLRALARWVRGPACELEFTTRRRQQLDTAYRWKLE